VINGIVKAQFLSDDSIKPIREIFNPGRISSESRFSKVTEPCIVEMIIKDNQFVRYEVCEEPPPDTQTALQFQPTLNHQRSPSISTIENINFFVKYFVKEIS